MTRDDSQREVTIAPGIRQTVLTKNKTDAFDRERDKVSAIADAELERKLDAKYEKVDAIFEKIGTGKHLSVADVVTLSDGTINILFFKKLLENDFGPDKYVEMLGELEALAKCAEHDADRIKAIDVLCKKIEQIMRLGVDKKEAHVPAVVNIVFPVEFVEVKNFYAERKETCQTVVNLSESDSGPVPDNCSGNPVGQDLGTPSDS